MADHTAALDPLELTIVEKHRETPTISRFTFAHADSAPLPGWQPGAHLTLHLSAEKTREYSLCGDDPDAGTWTVAVLRETTGRGGSIELHDHLNVGDRLLVTPPINTFALAPAEKYLLIAGGIGITPLITMIEHLKRRGASWQLVYLVRERVNAAFLDRIGTADNITLWVSSEQGRFDLAELRTHTDDTTAVYACGPTELLTTVEALWADAPDQLHTEYFRGVGASAEGDDSFDVMLAKTGATVHVGSGESILAAVEAAVPSISIYQSCLEGVCGSCETRVLDGIPDHRDLVLTKRQKERNDRMMICVSRVLGDSVTLDL